MPCRMTFEFDHRKSSANRSRHGIDFVDAQDIWRDRRDPDRMQVAARSTDEPRWQVVGAVGAKHSSSCVWRTRCPRIVVHGDENSSSCRKERESNEA